jgi:hypothetical protein
LKADGKGVQNVKRRSVLRSVGAVLPAAVLLAGCPNQCAPTPDAQPAPAAAPAAAGGQFTADFSSPEELHRFDWQVFHGGVNPFPRTDQPRTWQGDHDASCGAPTTLRNVSLVGETGPGPVANAGDLVWWCAPGGDAAKGHVMTSIAGVAYVSIDFSPRQVFNNISRVCWDQNWTEMGGRKWTQVAVIPESVFNANGNRLDYVMPSLQGDVAVNGEYLSGGAFMLSMIRASTQVFVGQDFEWTDFGGFQTTDKARRFRQCIVDQGGSVRLELERENGTEVRNVPGASLPDGPVRVIFQDSTYDSVKGDMSQAEAVRTNTWHWDNVSIS